MEEEEVPRKKILKHKAIKRVEHDAPKKRQPSPLKKPKKMAEESENEDREESDHQVGKKSRSKHNKMGAAQGASANIS